MQLILKEMDYASDGCLEVATTEKSGAEQPSASSERPVSEAENGSPAEKLLLSEATGTLQCAECTGEGWEEQSSLEQSRKEQKPPSLAQSESPCEGLNNGVTRKNGQDVFESGAPFSELSESLSLVTSGNYPALLEIDSRRGKQTSHNSILSEDVASGIVTGKEVTKKLDIKALQILFFPLTMASCTPLTLILFMFTGC